MIRKNIILLFLTIIGLYSFSQTPITNTNFYKAYQKDFHIVSIAENEGVLNDEIAKFLLSPKVANDIKVAIINAMSFDIIEKNNTDAFLAYLSRKYMLAQNDVAHSDSLSASELLCIGYLLTMDDYFDTEEAFKLLGKAKELNPDDHTINVVYFLVKAHQSYMFDPCNALEYFDHFPSTKIYTDYLLPEAEQIIFDYFNELKVKCK